MAWLDLRKIQLRNPLVMRWFHVKCFFTVSHVHFRNICDGKTRISKSWETLPECLQELWTRESAPSCFKGRPWEQSLQSRNTLLHINDAYWGIKRERGSNERRGGKTKRTNARPLVKQGCEIWQADRKGGRAEGGHIVAILFCGH